MNDGKLDQEIDRRLTAMSAVVRALSWRPKFLIHWFIFVPILTYFQDLGSDRKNAWIHAAKMSYFWVVAGLSLRDKAITHLFHIFQRRFLNLSSDKNRPAHWVWCVLLIYIYIRGKMESSRSKDEFVHVSLLQSRKKKENSGSIQFWEGIQNKESLTSR